MRLFLAIDLPLKVKEKIENRLKDIKQKYPEFKWVGELNYHITIHFFGDNIFHKNMGDKIKQALFDTFSFYLYSSECKLFIRRKIILYLGFKRNKELEKMAHKVIRVFDPSKKIKFVPHLSLARYKIPSKQQYLVLKKRIRNLEIDLEFKVNKLTLFNCINYNTKPEYKIVKEFKLLEE